MFQFRIERALLFIYIHLQNLYSLLLNFEIAIRKHWPISLLEKRLDFLVSSIIHPFIGTSLFHLFSFSIEFRALLFRVSMMIAPSNNRAVKRWKSMENWIFF